MRCGENPVHERMNSIAENTGEIKTMRQGRISGTGTIVRYKERSTPAQVTARAGVERSKKKNLDKL